MYYRKDTFRVYSLTNFSFIDKVFSPDFEIIHILYDILKEIIKLKYSGI